MLFQLLYCNAQCLLNCRFSPSVLTTAIAPNLLSTSFHKPQLRIAAPASSGRNKSADDAISTPKAVTRMWSERCTPIKSTSNGFNKFCSKAGMLRTPVATRADL